MSDLNELRKIIADAPKNAGNYHKSFKQYYGGTSCLNLDNLRTIVEQSEQIAELELKLKGYRKAEKAMEELNEHLGIGSDV